MGCAFKNCFYPLVVDVRYDRNFLIETEVERQLNSNGKSQGEPL